MSLFKDFPPIYETIGEDGINRLPKLDIGNLMGYSDYIDFIKAEDMSHPIMIGIDCCQRPFIAIKVRTSEGNDIVGTFFQRYTNESSIWAYGTCYSGNTIFHKSRFHSNYDIETLTKRLHKLFYNKTVKIYGKNCDDFVNGNGPGTITLIY